MSTSRANTVLGVSALVVLLSGLSAVIGIVFIAEGHFGAIPGVIGAVGASWTALRLRRSAVRALDANRQGSHTADR